MTHSQNRSGQPHRISPTAHKVKPFQLKQTLAIVADGLTPRLLRSRSLLCPLASPVTVKRTADASLVQSGDHTQYDVLLQSSVCAALGRTSSAGSCGLAAHARAGIVSDANAHTHDKTLTRTGRALSIVKMRTAHAGTLRTSSDPSHCRTPRRFPMRPCRAAP